MLILASINEQARHRGIVYCTTHSGQMKQYPWLSIFAPEKRAVWGHKYHGWTWQQFDQAYWAKLERDRAEIMKWLDTLDQGRDVTLLCYCNASTRRAGNCHLSMVAKVVKKYRPDITVEM